MLFESSTTTATMFCCGRKVATLNAGCHKTKSNKVTSRVCINQMPAERKPPRAAELALRSLHRGNASTAAASARHTPRVQRGHRPRNTNWPLANSDAGYLKKNSNIDLW